jgi:hypothetical protein
LVAIPAPFPKNALTPPAIPYSLSSFISPPSLSIAFIVASKFDLF